MIRTRVLGREGIAKGLCGTCRHSHITMDDRGDQVVVCEETYPLPYVVQRVIVACNTYGELQTGMSKDEATKIGWIIQPRSRVSQVGFTGAPDEVDILPPTKAKRDRDEEDD